MALSNKTFAEHPMKLYDYYRSTASYRVRIALKLKDMPYEAIPVHLVNQGGEQHFPQYQALNPQSLVPTLIDHKHIISQSLAIIEYLDEIKPLPALLPKDPIARAHVRQLALIIACDMHPLNNLRVLQQLKKQLSANEIQINQWYHHWLKQGFDAIERLLETYPRDKSLCYGNQVSLADICLIPQVYNANRYHFSMENYPLINRITSYCLAMPAFDIGN